MKRVKDLLKQTHLLTLAGSGGAGKTRFALQAGADMIDDFANGVWIVELATLTEPSYLPKSLMKVLGVKEEPDRIPEETLCNYLKDKQTLIILDNCEHLVDECAKLSENLLNNCRKLKIIATSREALLCNGEQVHQVLPLSHPDLTEEISYEKLMQYEAVSLFIERALAVNPDFRIDNNSAPALAQICFQLDGIPLAIELAAARTKVLSVEKIYQRLNDRFNLLTGGKRTSLPRQQTLKALIDWSYDLLTEKEKILWRRLSVFRGGWTLNSAEKICSDEIIKENELLDLLHNLTGKSIIIFENAKDRYMILETIRQYGAEKFTDADEFVKIKNNHTLFFMRFADTAEPQMLNTENSKWLELLDLEFGNLHAAHEWLNNNENKSDDLRFKVTLEMWHTLKKSLTG
jgi:predicted ATPase